MEDFLEVVINFALQLARLTGIMLSMLSRLVSKDVFVVSGCSSSADSALV